VGNPINFAGAKIVRIFGISKFFGEFFLQNTNKAVPDGTALLGLGICSLGSKAEGDAEGEGHGLEGSVLLVEEVGEGDAADDAPIVVACLEEEVA